MILHLTKGECKLISEYQCLATVFVSYLSSYS